MGRKSKLTQELIKQAAGLIAAGNYIEVASRALGIDQATWYRWIERGNKEQAGLYCEFCEAIKKAEAAAEARAVGNIMTAGRTTWQANAWYLERKYPDRWGRKDRTEPPDPAGLKDLVASLRVSRKELADGSQ